MLTQERFNFRDLAIAAAAPLLWGTMPAAAALVAVPDHPLLIAASRSFAGGLALILAFRQWPPEGWRWKILPIGTVNTAIEAALEEARILPPARHQ